MLKYVVIYLCVTKFKEMLYWKKPFNLLLRKPNHYYDIKCLFYALYNTLGKNYLPRQQSLQKNLFCSIIEFLKISAKSQLEPLWPRFLQETRMEIILHMKPFWGGKETKFLKTVLWRKAFEVLPGQTFWQQQKSVSMLRCCHQC